MLPRSRGRIFGRINPAQHFLEGFDGFDALEAALRRRSGDGATG